MPPRTVLDQTFNFAKQTFFGKKPDYFGLSTFKLRFHNDLELKYHNIHPFEPYLQFAKYTRNVG